MGKKSKSRGKSKRGGKQQQRSPGANNAAEEPGDSMQLLEKCMGRLALIRGRGNMEKALEIKAKRDEFDKLMSSKSKDWEELDEAHRHVAIFSLAKLTVKMAQCGLVEEEKHSSFVYVEENVNKFDGMAEPILKEWKDATDEVEWGHQNREQMMKLIIDGDKVGQMRLLQDVMRVADKEEKDKRIELGLPPMPENDHLHNTILDDELFQPCPPSPDCPICFLPLPGRNETCYQPCCGKTLCDGCIFAHRDAKDALGEKICCPFCRDPVATTDLERKKKTEERSKHDDKEAFFMLGSHYFIGKSPYKQNRKKGEELLNRAAELGSEAAHFMLGMAYYDGEGVKKNKKKALSHFRRAAIGGLLEARYHLGKVHISNPELQYKHFVIAAEAGHVESLKEVKTGHAEGHVEKDVFEKVIRAHKAAKEEVKSEAREKAADWYRSQKSAN